MNDRLDRIEAILRAYELHEPKCPQFHADDRRPRTPADNHGMYVHHGPCECWLSGALGDVRELRFSVRFIKNERLIVARPLDQQTKAWCRSSRAPGIFQGIYTVYQNKPVAQETVPLIAAEIAEALRLEYPNADIDVRADDGAP